MKIDLTKLDAVDQVAAVMKVLQRRLASGAQATHASDLLRNFKHRAFRTQGQRVAYFSLLLNAAAAALSGDQAKTKEHFAKLEAAAVIIEVNDRVTFDGDVWLVRDVLPEGKLLIKRGEGTRTVLARDCTPILPNN